MRILDASEYEVATDGRTVWVNAPNCVARFCPSSAEVFYHDGGHEVREVSRGDKLASRSTWLWFRDQITAAYGITLKNSHAPKWMRTGAVIRLQAPR